MQEKIQIIAQYPDLGKCLRHWQDITRVCCQNQCIRNRSGFYCIECTKQHSKHYTISSKEYVEGLARKLVGFQEEGMGGRLQRVAKVFGEFRELTDGLHVKITEVIKLLKTINKTQIRVIQDALTLSEPQMYAKLCQLNLTQNSQQLTSIFRTISSLKLSHPKAVESYSHHYNTIYRRLQKYMVKIDNLVNETLEITELLGFGDVLRDLERPAEERINSQSKDSLGERKSVIGIFGGASSSKQVDNQKDKQKDRPQSQQFVDKIVTDFSLRHKEFDDKHILEKFIKLRDSGSIQKITNIDIQGNSLSNQGLRELLITQKFHFISLKKLILKSNFLYENCSQILLQTNNLPALKHLDISSNLFTQLGPGIVVKIKNKWPEINIIT